MKITKVNYKAFEDSLNDLVREFMLTMDDCMDSLFGSELKKTRGQYLESSNEIQSWAESYDGHSDMKDEVLEYMVLTEKIVETECLCVGKSGQL